MRAGILAITDHCEMKSAKLKSTMPPPVADTTPGNAYRSAARSTDWRSRTPSSQPGGRAPCAPRRWEACRLPREGREAADGRERPQQHDADGRPVETSPCALRRVPDHQPQRHQEQTEAMEEVGSGEHVARRDMKPKSEQERQPALRLAAESAPDNHGSRNTGRSHDNHEQRRRAREILAAGRLGEEIQQTIRQGPKITGSFCTHASLSR